MTKSAPVTPCVDTIGAAAVPPLVIVNVTLCGAVAAPTDVVPGKGCVGRALIAGTQSAAAAPTSIMRRSHSIIGGTRWTAHLERAKNEERKGPETGKRSSAKQRWCGLDKRRHR